MSVSSPARPGGGARRGRLGGVSGLAAALLLAALAVPAHADDSVRGPRKDRIDLYKAWPGGDKLYVEVDLGDGVPRVMLLDSGAGVSLLVPEVAEALGLALSDDTDTFMQVSGTLEARRAVVPEVQLGRYRIRDVVVAVPEVDVHDRAGGVEMAGLLGNNVLSRFQVVVDYPANRLELRRPGTLPVPDGAAPLYFDGQHAMTGAVLVAEGPAGPVEEQVLVDVDTGARGVWLFGAVGDELAALATEGLEPVIGVSSSAGTPLSSLLRVTRKLPLTAVRAGGVEVTRELDATWTAYEGSGSALAASTPGLLGHDVLDGYRVLLDYGAQRFALMPAKRERAERDVHDWKLRSLRRSTAPDKLVRVAELQLWSGEEDAARSTLERHHRRDPAEPEGAVLLARLLRLQGDADRAVAVLDDVAPAGLVDEGEAAAMVNSLALAGRPEDALALARAAVEARPEEAEAWLALADGRRAAGELSGARDALLEANRLAESPDGHLLRRAWLSAVEGDDFGALTHLRRALELDPSGVVTPWFYGIVAARAGQAELLARDLEEIQAGLHPGQGALDFLAAAWARVGEQERALALAAEGRSRDCERPEEEARRLNCEAWYRGIVGDDLDLALERIEAAMALEPGRSEFLDTYGVILEARGDLSGAADAARQAARLSPADPYLLWQADRLARAAAEQP